MALNVLSFKALVQRSSAAVQSSASGLLNLTAGSTLRAILEASASVGLWVQYLILQVLATTRAATSIGPDLDTWWIDFKFTRLPSNQATGLVTFSRKSATSYVVIQPGSTVKTLDGSVSFNVYVDTSNPAWSFALEAYSMPPGTASLTLSVVAVTAGTAGNVQAGAIGLIAGSGLPGIDAVSNAVAFVNGIDAEADAPGRVRFGQYINSRSRATLGAIGYAVASVQQNLTYTIQENTPTPGTFIVTVDDGSGTPSAGLLAAVAASVNAYRPIGSLFTVQPPSVLSAAVSFTIVTAPGYVHSTQTSTAATAVTTFIEALPMGAALPYTRIAQLVYDSAPGIANVQNVLINGGTADVGGGPAQVVRASSVIAS